MPEQTREERIAQLQAQLKMEEVITDPAVSVIPEESAELARDLWLEVAAVEKAMKPFKERLEVLRGMLKGMFEPGDEKLALPDGTVIAEMVYPQPTRTANTAFLHEQYEEDARFWIVKPSTPRMTVTKADS